MAPRYGIRSVRGFSLIEVVVATAIFAGAIVAVVGLLSPISRRVDDVIDSETAARLSAAIQLELERLGFADAVTLTAGSPIDLVANPAASHVRLLSGVNPPANNALNDASMPGIAERDRYFLITLARQTETGLLTYNSATSGALALRADVSWPFHVPEGPASVGVSIASGEGADPHIVVPEPQRQRLTYFFALRP